ncbi:MAG: DedA family protein [Treponema sp.]|nr:DedA family protein [Treponema sp.]
MPDFYALLLNYVDYFPLIAFAALLLAGLNLPISEELVIITGAFVCHENHHLTVPTLIAIFTGIITTDCFVYWVGTRVRKGAVKSKFLSRLIPEKALDKMHYYLDKYGLGTFIVCRFIPFGVRNTLFFSSGLFKLKFRFFAIYDVTAAIISISTIFYLAWRFGSVMEKPAKIAGIVLFALIIAGVISIIIRFFIIRRKKIVQKQEEIPQK